MGWASCPSTEFRMSGWDWPPILQRVQDERIGLAAHPSTEFRMSGWDGPAIRGGRLSGDKAGRPYAATVLPAASTVIDIEAAPAVIPA